MEPFSEINQDRQLAIKRAHRALSVTLIFLPTLALTLLLVFLLTAFLLKSDGRSFVQDLLLCAGLVLFWLLGTASFVRRLTPALARAVWISRLAAQIVDERNQHVIAKLMVFHEVTIQQPRRVWISPRAFIMPGTLICGAAIIEEGVRLSRDTFIGHETWIEREAILKDACTIVGPRVRIGRDTQLFETWVDEGVEIGGDAFLARCFVRAGSVVRPGVHLIDESVPPGVTVSVSSPSLRRHTGVSS